ncbi:MBOAT family protein [soil metagenome]
MSFNSLQYFALFGAVLVVYFQLRAKGQNRLMVLASAVFYGAFDWRFLLLLYTSTLIDYTVARRIDATDAPRTRKAWLAVSIVSQLGILGFFKYVDFFSDSLSGLFGYVGWEADPFTLNVVLPVGISFYTFQTLAYVLSVYRRQLPAERNLVTFAAFVSWFPQLVAGPIERAPQLLPQIKRRRDAPDLPTVESGVMLIVQGLFKKVVIADSLAGYVTAVYADPASHGWTALVLATVGFAVQVYGDFSGYTDIARGSSRLLGVELRRNFEQPFLSRDIREFWQRWHTSLGGWFVENVAQPLGGNRKGPRRAAINVLIVFTLIGLWHGAAWTFVLWGALNGVLVVIWRWAPTSKRRHPMRLRLADLPGIAFTFGLFSLGVVLFRAASLGDAGDVFSGILTMQAGQAPVEPGQLVPIMLAAVFFIDVTERRRRVAAIETVRAGVNLGGLANQAEAVIEAPAVRLGALPAGVTIGLMAAAVMVFSGGAPTPFIYFQF